MTGSFNPVLFDQLPWEMRYKLVTSSCNGWEYSAFSDEIQTHAIRDKNRIVRQKAVRAYSYNYHRSLRLLERYIIPMFESADSISEKVEAIHTLLWVPHLHNKTQKTCLKWLKNELPEVRRAALRVLTRWQAPSSVVYKKVVKALDDPEWSVRLAAFRCLRTVIQKEPIHHSDLLVKALQDEKVDIQAFALHTLANTSGKVSAEVTSLVNKLANSQHRELAATAKKIIMATRYRTIEEELTNLKYIRDELQIDIDDYPYIKSFEMLEFVLADNANRVNVIDDEIFVIGLSGNIWKVKKNEVFILCKNHCCSQAVCLSTGGVPLGDRLATVVLGLLDDVTTKQRIYQVEFAMRRINCNFEKENCSRSKRSTQGEAPQGLQRDPQDV